MGSFRSLAQGLSSEREKNFKQTCEPAKKLPCPEPTVRSFGGFPKMKRASQVALVVKNPPANTGDLRRGSTPGSGRSSGGGHSNPLQHPCLENPMDRGAWRAAVQSVAKSRTRLKPTHSKMKKWPHAEPLGTLQCRADGFAHQAASWHIFFTPLTLLRHRKDWNAEPGSAARPPESKPQLGCSLPVWL